MKIPTYIEEYCDGRKCNLNFYTMKEEEEKKETGRKTKKYIINENSIIFFGIRNRANTLMKIVLTSDSMSSAKE